MWAGIGYIISVIFSYCFWFCVFLILKYHSISFENCENVDDCCKVLNTEFWKQLSEIFCYEYDAAYKPTYIIYVVFGNIIGIICFLIWCISKLIIFIIKKIKIKQLLYYVYYNIKTIRNNINMLFHNLLSKIKIK